MAAVTKKSLTVALSLLEEEDFERGSAQLNSSSFNRQPKLALGRVPEL